MKRPDVRRLLRRWGLPALIALLAGFSLWQLLTRPLPEAESAATPGPTAAPPPAGLRMTEGDYLWEAREDGAAVLLAYTGEADVVRVPASFGGLPLRRVGDGAFRDCAATAEVTLPEGTAEIGAYAFYGSGLRRLTLPGGVTDIGRWAVPAGVRVICPPDSDTARCCDRQRIPWSPE